MYPGWKIIHPNRKFIMGSLPGLLLFAATSAATEPSSGTGGLDLAKNSVPGRRFISTVAGVCL